MGVPDICQGGQGGWHQIWVSGTWQRETPRSTGSPLSGTQSHSVLLTGTDPECVNFSDVKMRDEGGEQLMSQICEAFGKNIKAHIDVYGAHNEQRLTGHMRPSQSMSSRMGCLTVVHR